jgi:sugar phosphate permease
VVLVARDGSDDMIVVTAVVGNDVVFAIGMAVILLHVVRVA